MSRPAAGGGRWVTTAPERLQRWLDGFASRHGAVVREFDDRTVRLVADDGALAEIEVPFPPLSGGLVEHVLRDRRVGVLLVRLGGCACGVFDGPRLTASKVTTRQVHGRSAAGGQSQQRFARRREGQVRVALDAFADTAARILLPAAGSLDAVVVGGERTAVDTVLAPPARRVTAAGDRAAAGRPRPAAGGAGGVLRPAAGRVDPGRRPLNLPASKIFGEFTGPDHCGRLEDLDRATTQLGGSSFPASSMRSASCLVLCTAPSACSGGPYTV